MARMNSTNVAETDFAFQQECFNDSAALHSAKIVKICFSRENTPLLEWPAYIHNADSKITENY